MKKYDFIIVYELKNRELESACLLKYELERRGYSVFIVETWWTKHTYYEPVYADVMITFALYSEEQMDFTLQFARGVKKIINMCWEQIFTNAEECADDSLHHITGKAKEMLHVAWGRHSMEWLGEVCGIPRENLIPSGHIGMDFTKPRLKSYYMTRNELLRKYELPTDKKVVLFISSFSYVGLADLIVNNPDYENDTFSASAFQRLSVDSQDIILHWFREAAGKHPECVFIYRPHPAEASNKRLLAMQKEIRNFKVINEQSVKQWILASDIVYSWYSTSVADAYFSKKDVGILRPVEIPRDMEVTTLNNCNFITAQDEFEKTLLEGVSPSDSLHATMECYYFYDEDTYSYEIISDSAGKALCEVRGSDTYPELKSKYIDNRDAAAVIKLKNAVKMAMARIDKLPGATSALALFSRKLAERVSYEAYTADRIKENRYSEYEMQQTIERIKKAVDSAD